MSRDEGRREGKKGKCEEKEKRLEIRMEEKREMI